MHFYCCIFVPRFFIHLRLRISRVEDTKLSWFVEQQNCEKRKIRQTTNLDCNHGNKPAVTFNCASIPSIPVFDFTILFFQLPHCCVASTLSVFRGGVCCWWCTPNRRAVEKKKNRQHNEMGNKFKSFEGIRRWELTMFVSDQRQKTRENSYLRIEKYTSFFFMLYAICHPGLVFCFPLCLSCLSALWMSLLSAKDNLRQFLICHWLDVISFPIRGEFFFVTCAMW